MKNTLDGGAEWALPLGCETGKTQNRSRDHDEDAQGGALKLASIAGQVGTIPLSGSISASWGTVSRAAGDGVHDS
eukprot:CAMPEP_0204375068 /NCGR_PEP_ID=MMETSP0469-20131031/48994_1 /ASSEMBLY_ACC=CAM_ASM_000384 /TAXON_ID=2969 /ORGANISM="Oxyrrhis marina" /LENGTH=74 /DNA_ID=CAMNT_0051365703 /DNA_START=1544 /DNA_END=1765 /DNA_ORIENTATION=-